MTSELMTKVASLRDRLDDLEDSLPGGEGTQQTWMEMCKIRRILDDVLDTLRKGTQA
jgi:hypothetical protein